MSSILSSRDINAPISADPSPNGPNTKENTNNKPVAATKNMSMDYHRQMLQSKLNEDNHQKTYISPSDTIQSPCTQKLSAFKEKRFSKAKPQSLFAKTTAGRGLGQQQQQQQQLQQELMGEKEVGKEEGDGVFEKMGGEKEA